MVTISAYLTRQVNGGGGTDAFKKKHLNKLKNAVMLGDFDSFIQTLHVIVSPEGQLQFETTNQGGRTQYIYNPYTSERYVEGWSTIEGSRIYYKGASFVPSGRDGLRACLYKQEHLNWQGKIGADTVDSGHYCGTNQIGSPDYHGRPQSEMQWYIEDFTSTSGSSESHEYRITALCTIPIFSSYEAAMSYESLVDTYIDSKDDDDLRNISDLMDSDLLDFDYDTE